jgi:hypothetical protein
LERVIYTLSNDDVYCCPLVYLQEVCVPVTCPENMVLSNGRCLPLIDQQSGRVVYAKETFQANISVSQEGILEDYLELVWQITGLVSKVTKSQNKVMFTPGDDNVRGETCTIIELYLQITIEELVAIDYITEFTHLFLTMPFEVSMETANGGKVRITKVSPDNVTCGSNSGNASSGWSNRPVWYPKPTDSNNIIPSDGLECQLVNSTFGNFVETRSSTDGMINSSRDIRNCIPQDVIVVAQTAGSFPDIEIILTYSCMSISCVALVVSIVTYRAIPFLRTFPGRVSVCLMGMLLLAQVVFMGGVGLRDYPVACTGIAVLMHYTWLSTVAWMCTSCFHMWFTFASNGQLSMRESSARRSIWIKYRLFACGLPFCIVLGCTLTDFLYPGTQYFGYGKTVCFISEPVAVGFAFALPIGFAMLVNILLFCLSARAIHAMPVLTTTVNRPINSLVFLKLSSLMGLMWLIGFLAELLNLMILRLLFIVANGLQGLLIFIAFVCSKRVVFWYKTKLMLALRGKAHARSKVISVRTVELVELPIPN